ncbi:two-component system, OmpR family, sensor histidine kinase KdpD [Gammaproteobacteria bacterium]
MTIIDQTKDMDDVLKNPPIEFSEEAKRGSLKIFLGYCAGVGKTYRMLQDSIVNKRNGIDVVIGIVETHGRADTEALVSEFEIVPRKNVEYSGITISEMDLDMLLVRRPQVVLVDELAHTNIPGSRHAKRYQDVEELLNAGINVYSTLNIQHVQSLVDIVYQITGIKVEEIIPDRILDLAIEVELVDLSPEKLQQRLAEGKVYIPQKAKQAMEKFFKKGNLLALRELSLKYTAKRVDSDLLSYREKEDILSVWPIESKLLVGISSNKITEKLLLLAHRMAIELEAEWYAVHVESLQQVQETEKTRSQLYRNIHLAEELGAKVVSLSGSNIADEIIQFAKRKNVNLIITGLSQRPHLQELIRGSVLNELVKKASPINLLVVGDDSRGAPPAAQLVAKKLKTKPFFYGFFSVIIVLLFGWFFQKWISAHNLIMLMLLPTIVSGILWGISVGLVTSVLALGLVDFLFITPTFSFGLFDARYLTDMVLFILIVLGVSWVGRMIRWRAESARHRERFIYALYNFGREILGAESFNDILNRAVRSVVEAFDSDIVILLPGTSGALELTAKSRVDLELNEMEKAVATWVYKNGRHAGKGTNTLSSAKWYYVPLKIRDNVLGVICLMKLEVDKTFSPEQKRLLESFASMVALALSKTNK